MKEPAQVKAGGGLGREGKITALGLMKNFYDEEIFTLLAREFYDSDMGVSETAIAASGSLGNEIAISRLYQIIEQGKKSQRIAAIRALAGIRAPSSVEQLIKYFNHFPEEEIRAEVLRAINTIAPSSQPVAALNQAVYSDQKQGETVRQVAAESLVDAEMYALLRDTLPRVSAGVQQAALVKMLQSGSLEVFDLDVSTLSPTALGVYLCLHTMKSKSTQPAFVLETLQKSSRQTVYSFLQSLSQFQGRLRYPTRVFRLLLICPYNDRETEALIGDFLKKVVTEVKNASPHLLSEFSVVASSQLDTVFANKVLKNYISLRGITNKEVLLATIFATLMEKYAKPTLLADVQAFFKDEGFTARTPPLAQVRNLLSSAPREDLNRFEACIPLFTYTEKKDRMQVASQLAKVDLNRPFFLRRLNRLIRVAGALEIRSASKKIQEILDFARVEKIHFLEETSVVTLCQLLTRSIIEQSREYFREPAKNIRSLNGYIRGARFIPARIMIGPLIQVLLVPSLNPQSRALVVESLEAMDLSSSQKALAPLLKILDMKEVDDALKLRVGDLLCRTADPSMMHQAMDLTAHAAPAARKVGARLLRAASVRSESTSSEEVTGRLYKLLEDKDKSVRVESLQALLAIGDDYAPEVLNNDYIQAGDHAVVAEVLASLPKTLSHETFEVVLKAIRLDSTLVQQALRKLLAELSQGEQSDEIKRYMAAALTLVPGGPTGPQTAAAVLMSAAPVESALSQGKTEFKFKREHMQKMTVFFIDIAGYTEKSQSVDNSTLIKIIKAFEEIVTSTVTEWGGTIVKKMGDGILAVFMQPVRAVKAALEVQRKIHEHSSVRVEQEKFQVRVGLNTGKVIRRDNDVFGDVVNVASRMQGVAAKGDVVLTKATYEEIKDCVNCTDGGKVQVKGIKDPIMAYYAKEMTVDLNAIAEDAAGKESQDASLQKLKESMFVPRFEAPAGLSNRSSLVSQLKSVFSDMSRDIEDMAADYHEQYYYKKLLQDRWNSLLKSL